MPRGDRTGPLGMGAMTGRGAGFCTGYPAPGYANPVLGGGFGARGGRGWRNRLYATGQPGWAWANGPAFVPPTQEQQTASLSAEAERLKSILADIERQLDQLRAKGGE